jgi:hypothetical protein
MQNNILLAEAIAAELNGLNRLNYYINNPAYASRAAEEALENGDWHLLAIIGLAMASNEE